MVPRAIRLGVLGTLLVGALAAGIAPAGAVAAPAPAGSATGPRVGTRVYPDDPNLSYTEYDQADITHDRARFTRPGPPNGAYVASPGTRVNFAADATTIWVELEYRPDNCNLAGCGLFWLEVDGILQRRGFGSDTVEGIRRYRIFTQPTAVQHDFSLIYPWGPAVDFRGLGLDGGTPGLISPPPERPDLLFVAYGDSITQGQAATGIVKTYPDEVARRKTWSVLNMGYGGEWVVPGDGTVVGQLGGDLVTVSIGINDYNLSLPVDRTRLRYDLFLVNLRAEQPVTPVYCIVPIWGTSESNPNGQGAVPEDYREVIRQVVAEHMLTDPNLFLIEGLDLVPHSPDFFADGLHPNDEGFFLYARNLAPLLPG